MYLVAASADKLFCIFTCYGTNISDYCCSAQVTIFFLSS